METAEGGIALLPGTKVAERPYAREVHRPRTIEELRKTMSMLCHFIWHRSLRPGEHMWSIPVDKERDFDCILGDAITELRELREENAMLQQQIRELTN